ncbi:hypothetical protein AV926_09290 [Myroides marinus]|uniref:Knr4/Smi1-like domain-containing protein n=1 Tax=Myroides marinus TaxID=703342 RepID=A0A163Z446_9FLAO|nr:SMI1/KNR4 family protein [Myroides marinus]KZE80958.1 hypothetical protein AV926_09290 [Myroides marinus]
MKNIFLKDYSLEFNVIGEKITIDDIINVVVEDFKGKEDFIQFYLATNGVFFSGEPVVSTEKFTNDDEYYEIDLECFYKLENIVKMRNAIKNRSVEASKFVETHIPFATNAAGNDFFIEIPTGEIKYISWEDEIEEGLIWIAPSFKDFCSAIISREED